MYNFVSCAESSNKNYDFIVLLRCGAYISHLKMDSYYQMGYIHKLPLILLLDIGYFWKLSFIGKPSNLLVDKYWRHFRVLYDAPMLEPFSRFLYNAEIHVSIFFWSFISWKGGPFLFFPILLECWNYGAWKSEYFLIEDPYWIDPHCFTSSLFLLRLLETVIYRPPFDSQR